MNKYITLSNSNKLFDNNTNGYFNSKIDQIVLKKSYKCALVDFSYCNKISKNLGSIEIHLNNSDTKINEKHNNFIIIFNTSFDLLRDNINNYLKSIATYHIIDIFDNQAEIDNKYKSLAVLVNELHKLYKQLYQYMIENKEKNYRYYRTHLLSTEPIFKKLNTMAVKDDKIIQELDNLNFNELIKKIKEFSLNNFKSFYLKLDFQLYNKWSNDAIVDYLAYQITQNSNFKMNSKFNKNKIIFTINDKLNSSLICNLYGDAIINNFFIITKSADKKTVEINIPKVFNFIKAFYVHTDIIEETQLMNKKQAVIQAITSKGDFLEDIFINYDRPKYFNINKTLINYISIKITNQDNEILDFESPPTLTLSIIQNKWTFT